MRTRRGQQRTIVVAMVALAMTGWAAFGGGVGGALAEGEAAALVEATNGSRQRLAGVDSLTRAADLDAVAQRQAEAMAARGGLFHNPNLATQVANWRLVAENVGVGADIAAIHQAFLDSASHRANVLDARLTQLGVGVVVGGDGRLWVVEVFRTPVAAAASAAPVAPARVTAPKAAPAPSPAIDPARLAAEAAAAELRRAEATARAAAAAEAEAQARAEAERAAAVAAEIAAVAGGIDLTPQEPYVAGPVVLLSDTQLVSSSAPADPSAPSTARPAVLLAGALWMLVALSLLRRMRSDVVHTTPVLRRLVTPPVSA